MKFDTKVTCPHCKKEYMLLNCLDGPETTTCPNCKKVYVVELIAIKTVKTYTLVEGNWVTRREGGANK